MQKQFNKILVPINFNHNTGFAVDKGIQLANKFRCDLYLLHVQTPSATIPFLYDGFFSGTFIKTSNEKSVSQLADLEARCKSGLEDGLSVDASIVLGSWQQVMKDIIIQEHVDLVIIPKGRRKFAGALIQRLNLNTLAQQTNCPVLTVTRKFNVSNLQNIVVPVNDTLPVQKLSLATYFCSDTYGSIHLMGSGGKTSGGREQRKFLIRAYQLLLNFGRVNIQCTLPDDFDNPATTLNYAAKINADLIVISTGKESRLKGWWNGVIQKYLYRESDIPVLTTAG